MKTATLKSRPTISKPTPKQLKSSAREARLEFRLTRQARERIEKAAILNGQTMSDFASSTLLRRADEVLDSHAERTLSQGEWERFVALLENPSKPNHALKSAAARYKKGKISSDKYSLELERE